ncbi:MAG: hypothetical protein RLZZ58_828 [Pseudomonadota bacterium]
MGLLIDTNVLIWLHSGDPRVSKRAADRIAGGDDILFVSVVSAWEYGQKRLKYPDQLPVAFDLLVASLPHERLDLPYAIHDYAESLPPLHTDPFDRMLIAQALHQDLELVASDATIRRYPVRTLW